MNDSQETATAGVVARANTQYSASDLKHLSDLDHVRTRFGMYIGDNTARGLHHLVFEVVEPSPVSPRTSLFPSPTMAR